MGVRYQAIWNSMDALQYKIEIDDTLYSGAVIDFEIGMDSLDGFSLSYEGDQSNLTTLIMPSAVTVNCVVQNSAFETLISDIVNAQEGRFFIKIHKYNSLGKIYELIWAGLVLSDQMQLEDIAFPYNCQLKASDGLARLKNIEYTTSSGTPKSFIEYLSFLLSSLDISQYWTTNVFISTAINWYNELMYSGSPAATLDPLKVSGVNAELFYRENSQGEMEGKNYFEMLEQICLAFNARLFIAKGRFYFIQINQLVNTTIYLRNYDKTGTWVSDTSALALNVSGFYRNGQYSFFRPLQFCSVEHFYTQADSQSNRLPYQSLYETPVDIGLFAGGDKELATFSGQLNLTMNETILPAEPHKWHFKLQLRIGNYYLENPGDTYSWSTNSAARVDIYSITYNTYVYTDALMLAFSTPEIPEVGNTIFELDFYQIEKPDGSPVSPPPTGKSYACAGFYLIQTGGDGSVKYFATNPTSGTLFDKQLPNLIVADGPSTQSDGRMKIYTPSSTWVDSKGQWNIGGSGSSYLLVKLLTAQALALQLSARRLYEGNIGGVTFWPFNVITINGNKFAFLSGSLNGNTNEWSGSWHEIKDT